VELRQVSEADYQTTSNKENTEPTGRVFPPTLESVEEEDAIYAQELELCEEIEALISNFSVGALKRVLALCEKIENE